MNGSSPNGGGTPRLDASTAARFWNDMFQASASFWLSQNNRFFSALEQMKEGKYGTSKLMQDFAQGWDAWLELLASPRQVGGQLERQLPTFLFVVDGEAEFIGPVDAPTQVFLPPEVTTTVTDLHPVGGTAAASISAQAHIQATLSSEGDRLEIRLVDFGRGKGPRGVKGISPGLYAGAVYATELATRRPLAIIYVLVEESAVA